MLSTERKTKAPPRPIAFTPGEPAGIGPDLAVMIASEALSASLVCFADPDLIAERAALLGVSVKIREITDPAACLYGPDDQLLVFPVRSYVSGSPGKPDRRNAQYVLDCIDTATEQCRSGNVGAIVTGPVQKSVINDAGIEFTGHTEYLAQRLKVPMPVMMLVSDDLRVALVTTHVPVRDVSELITRQRITAVLDILYRELGLLFGISDPRLCVCGLNPHAGENGLLGPEDSGVILPVLETYRERGLHFIGPVSADTAFTPQNRVKYDAIVAMYHDQGLAALKAIDFGNSVNITLGLPIIRTSVDHGTALDCAGTGAADPKSLRAAIQLARTLAFARQEPSAR